MVRGDVMYADGQKIVVEITHDDLMAFLRTEAGMEEADDDTLLSQIPNYDNLTLPELNLALWEALDELIPHSWIQEITTFGMFCQAAIASGCVGFEGDERPWKM